MDSTALNHQQLTLLARKAQLRDEIDTIDRALLVVNASIQLYKELAPAPAEASAQDG